MEQEYDAAIAKPVRVPWNKGKLVGAKPPLRPSHVWSIRTNLQIEGKKRDLALFNLAIDGKLRGCDEIAVRVDDIAPGGYSIDRATIRQKKTRKIGKLCTDGSDPASHRRIPQADRAEAWPIRFRRPRRQRCTDDTTVRPLGA